MPPSRYRNISNDIRELETLLALAEWMLTQETQKHAENNLEESETLVAERMARVAELNRIQIGQAEIIRTA